MEEKILQTKKNGMVMLLLTLLGYVAFTALFVYSLILLDTSLFPGILLMVLSILYWVAGIFLFCGLKVLKPQEALVLTLFGDYIGTLKGQGFYWVNPFCTAVNPAAGTKLSQSGDVNSGETGMAALLKAGNSSAQTAESTSKKISLKMMTLNNSRQKINDCLGNPVEIGIAVIWRVTDTAKAVFNVDNYKEYLSLQCDSALRNVVRVYPYDVAPDVYKRQSQRCRLRQGGTDPPHPHPHQHRAGGGWTVSALPGKDCAGCAQREDDRGHGCAGPRHSARTRLHRAGGAGRRVRHRRGRCGDAKSVIHTPETIRREQKHEYKICSGAGSGNHQQPCHPVRQ